MKILEMLGNKSLWEDYYNYKLEKNSTEEDLISALRNFIDSGAYLEISNSIKNHVSFSHPKKVCISKSKTSKKRVVYTFADRESFALKFITHQLKRYDGLFAPNLYSFRKNQTAKTAWDDVLRIKNLKHKYVYKVDISSYFNSVDPEKILPDLKQALSDNLELYQFLEQLLLDPYAEHNGTIIEENKGILPGAPVSAFFANLYLAELDHYFHDNRIPYMRYSDDIIVFADQEQIIQNYIITIKNFLSQKGLKVNTEKEILTPPGEKWEFLGFSYHNGTIDIGDVAMKKLKAKMRRKSRALLRWVEKKNLPREYAAKAFVKRFNAKLYENPVHNELTWTRWFFPTINTDKSLKQIDMYMQDCVRFLATGKRNKGRYNFTYDNIKALGYRNLVNEYYKYKELLKEFKD